MPADQILFFFQACAIAFYKLPTPKKLLQIVEVTWGMLESAGRYFFSRSILAELNADSANSLVAGE